MEETMHMDRLDQITQELFQLRDLFVRRLSDDKTKTRSLELLSEQNTALNKLLEERVLESLFRELLLVCDRIEASAAKDDFIWSIYDEILEVFARREICQIDDLDRFNPQIHKAIGTVSASESQPSYSISSVARNGYLIRGRLLRPAEVIVAVQSSDAENHATTS